MKLLEMPTIELQYNAFYCPRCNSLPELLSGDKYQFTCPKCGFEAPDSKDINQALNKWNSMICKFVCAANLLLNEMEIKQTYGNQLPTQALLPLAEIEIESPKGKKPTDKNKSDGEDA